MKNNDIQNIFIDMKSYELIQNAITLDKLVSFIQDNVDVSCVQPVSIEGIPFEVEYRPHDPFLTFVYTVQGDYAVDPCKNKFKENIYIYNKQATSAYDEDFCGHEYLLYTQNPSLVVVSYDGNDLITIDSSTGELIRRL